jgi:hypothetical protein
VCVNRVSNPASLHSALMPWDRAKLEDEKRRRLPVETATVKRHFEALQSLKVDVIKQQRLEEATFIVRSKALLKRSSDLGSEVVRNLEVGLHVRVLERRDNRVRLEDGWTSIVSQGGKVLLELARDNSAASSKYHYKQSAVACDL